MDDPNDTDDLQEPFNIRARNAGADLIDALLGRWYLILGALLLALTGAFYYLSVTPKTYQSTATVQVLASTAPSGMAGPNAVSANDDLRAADAINTIVGKFQLPSLYEAMLRDDPVLMAFPELLPAEVDWSPVWLRPTPADVGEQGFRVPPPAPPETDPAIATVTPAAAGPVLSPADFQAREMEIARVAFDLASCFEISNRRQTRLVDVVVSHSNPLMARRLGDALVRTYTKLYVDNRKVRAAEKLGTVGTETATVQSDLDKAENAMASYTTALNVVSKLQEQEAALSTLLLKYKDKHPDVVQSRQLLLETYEKFLQEFAAVRRSPADSVYWTSNPVAEKGADIESAVKEGVQILQARGRILSKEIERQQARLGTLQSQEDSAKVNQVSKEAEITVLQPANESELTKPKPPLIYAAAALGGLVLGAALALLLEKLDNKVHTVTRLEQTTNLPVLASVAALRPSVLKRSTADSDLLEERMKAWAPDLFFRDNGAKTIEAEMIRSLRTSIILLGPQESVKSILFTSALPGDGKSFISANVAASFAMQGLRTFLIDLDLRRPRLHSLFGTSRRKGAGVVDLLAGQCSLTDAIHPTGLENLYLMPAGTHAPNPGELLNVDRLKELLATLGGQCDRIIVDTAPLLPVSDTRLIARAADTCILVAGAEKTPKVAILRALELLGAYEEGADRIKFGGCVLNGTVANRGNLGYYGSYGEVYGADDEDDGERSPGPGPKNRQKPKRK